MAVQPGPSKPKAKSGGGSSELEVIFDSEITDQKTKKSTGDKKGSKKSKGPKSKQKKSMNLDGHYSSMSSHSQDDENQDNPVFKNASNCVKKRSSGHFSRSSDGARSENLGGQVVFC